MAGTRVLDEPGFVLHSIPYKETSLILDVFTRTHGRLALIAKGAKRLIRACDQFCSAFSHYSSRGAVNQSSEPSPSQNGSEVLQPWLEMRFYVVSISMSYW